MRYHYQPLDEREHSIREGEYERLLVMQAVAHVAAKNAGESERARCLEIAQQWPDNLLAREIARRIGSGE